MDARWQDKLTGSSVLFECGQGRHLGGLEGSMDPQGFMIPIFSL